MVAIGRAQAKGFNGGSATIVRAWNAIGEAPRGTKLVAAELTLELTGDSFDPDDIDVIDADTHTNHGSNPLLQRLTPDGQPAEWKDPVFTDQHRFRIIATWAVPVSVRRIELGYWGMALTGAATLFDKYIGPPMPAPQNREATGYASAGALVDGRQRHVLVVRCECPRTALDPMFNLVVGDQLLGTARALEVDDQLRPVTVKLETRPFYLRRTWLLEQIGPAGAMPTAVNEHGNRTALPAAIVVPANSLAALAATTA